MGFLLELYQDLGKYRTEIFCGLVELSILRKPCSFRMRLYASEGLLEVFNHCVSVASVCDLHGDRVLMVSGLVLISKIQIGFEMQSSGN